MFNEQLRAMHATLEREVERSEEWKEGGQYAQYAAERGPLLSCIWARDRDESGR